jgi:short subunit dehydrogenase-like uncharacterized protein
MINDKKWMVYGANGYTGALIVAEAKRRGLSPIIAGRSREPIRQLADQHGLEHRVFAIDEMAEHLRDIDALLLAAGPFSQTSARTVAACLATKTHYLDITGEISVFEACHRQDAAAKQAGIAVMPGVGFDVVPSDCLANVLRTALPEAISLELAFASGAASRGTLKTMVESLGQGGAVRIDGEIVHVPTAWRDKIIAFHDKPRRAVTIPWGDISTGFHSTGIGSIVVYMALPPSMINAMRRTRRLLPLFHVAPLQKLAKLAIEKSVYGPGEAARSAGKAELWGRVEDATGTAVEATLTTPEPYTLTARTAVESCQRLLAEPRAGALTAAMAFGADYITTFDGCVLRGPGEPSRTDPATPTAS